MLITQLITRYNSYYFFINVYQLLDESYRIKYQYYIGESRIIFRDIEPGNYKLRILVDNNGNGFYDESDFSKSIQSESSYLYKKSGSLGLYSTITIRGMWELNETWDLTLESQPL